MLKSNFPQNLVNDTHNFQLFPFGGIITISFNSIQLRGDIPQI